MRLWFKPPRENDYLLLRVIGSIITTGAALLVLVNLGLMIAVIVEALASPGISLRWPIYGVFLSFIGTGFLGIIIGQVCHLGADYATKLNGK